MRMKVSELVGRALARLGVAHAFGVVGSGNFDVTEALIAAGVPYTAARHEGGAATMADAFARMSDRVAIVTTHQGCGFTNALTGIGEAAKSRTPMIVLTADTAEGAVTSNFWVEQDAAAEAVGASSVRIRSASTALADTIAAYRLARDERHTVVLNLPIDIQEHEADDAGLDDVDEPPRVAPAAPASADIALLADRIRAAERPVFIAGRGARGAGSEIRALADHVGALIATGAVAKGLFEGDPWSLGISGGFSAPATAELIAESDLVVGWGCALNMWTTRHGKLIAPAAIVVQVDIEAAAIGRTRAVDMGVVGDCAATANLVLAEMADEAPRAGRRTPQTAERIATGSDWRMVDLVPLAEDGRIDPRIVTRELDRILPAERIVSTDSGNFMGYPSQFLAVPDQYGFCFTQAFQSIGLGLATAIGAAKARPERLPILGTGDGGFHMAIAELETAVRERIPLVVLVYNDAAYGAEVHHFRDAPDSGTIAFPESDFAAIARGFGAVGVTVRAPADLAVVEEWLESSPTGPIVIDAKIANDGGSWWLAEAFGH